MATLVDVPCSHQGCQRKLRVTAGVSSDFVVTCTTHAASTQSRNGQSSFFAACVASDSRSSLQNAQSAETKHYAQDTALFPMRDKFVANCTSFLKSFANHLADMNNLEGVSPEERLAHFHKSSTSISQLKQDGWTSGWMALREIAFLGGRVAFLHTQINPVTEQVFTKTEALAEVSREQIAEGRDHMGYACSYMVIYVCF